MLISLLNLNVFPDFSAVLTTRYGQDGDKNVGVSAASAGVNQLTLKVPHQRSFDSGTGPSNATAVIFRDSEGEVHSVSRKKTRNSHLDLYWIAIPSKACNQAINRSLELRWKFSSQSWTQSQTELAVFFCAVNDFYSFFLLQFPHVGSSFTWGVGPFAKRIWFVFIGKVASGGFEGYFRLLVNFYIFLFLCFSQIKMV